MGGGGGRRKEGREVHISGRQRLQVPVDEEDVYQPLVFTCWKVRQISQQY